jgi:acyl-CoA dehydrogenase
MLNFELTPEQEQLKTTARRFAEEMIVPAAPRHDEEESFPHEVCRQAWELGLMNVGIPREYGGLGLGELDTCLLVEQLNWGCSGIANALAANGLATHPLLIAGSDEQKRTYLSQLTDDCG